MLSTSVSFLFFFRYSSYFKKLTRSLDSDGHAPYVKNTARDSSIIFQNEHFDAATRRYQCVLTTGAIAGERFKILYDQRRMYKNGILVVINGDSVDAQDDGNGSVGVITMKERTNASVEIHPK